MILLTGANGFIGQNLLKSILNRGKQIITYSTNLSPAVESLKLENYRAQISEIIFCGGYVQHSPSTGNLENEAAKSWFVLNEILEKKYTNLAKITFFSTADVYKRGPLIDETSETWASNLYTSTKLSQESYLAEYADSQGIKLQIIRVGNTYGPGEGQRGKFIPTVIDCAIRGSEFRFYADPNSIIQPIFIEDLISVLNVICNQDVIFSVINLVGSMKVSLNDVVQEANLLKRFQVSNSVDLPYFENTFDIARLSHFPIGIWTTLSQGLRKEFEYEQKKFSNLRP